MGRPARPVPAAADQGSVRPGASAGTRPLPGRAVSRTPPRGHTMATVTTWTGHPVRSTYQSSPGPRRSLPATDALVIAPATYNSINKIALGLADNYAMTSVAELIGRQVPTVIVPFVNAALAARAPFRHAVASLRDEGVRLLLGPDDQWEPHPPGNGNERQKAFPWTVAFETAAQLAHESRPAAPGHA
ncbi:flavoprotein [Plantactinospora sp. KBS50]|uniref:flavoprotein n=1 Tax=Plantactinospora sp. KBS50 TaxID=2024580 RepID=UPI003518E7BA